MPGWIIDLVFKLAVQFGLPYLIAKWPWLQKFLSEDLIKVIEEFIKSMDSQKAKSVEIKSRAIAKAKKCTGIGCPVELKK